MLAFTQLIVVRHWLADFTANGKALDMRTSASRIASVQGTSVHGSFWGSYTFATLACISRGMQLCDHFVPGDGCTCKISGYGWIGFVGPWFEMHFSCFPFKMSWGLKTSFLRRGNFASFIDLSIYAYIHRYVRNVLCDKLEEHFIFPGDKKAVVTILESTKTTTQRRILRTQWKTRRFTLPLLVRKLQLAHSKQLCINLMYCRLHWIIPYWHFGQEFYDWLIVGRWNGQNSMNIHN